MLGAKAKEIEGKVGGYIADEDEVVRLFCRVFLLSSFVEFFLLCLLVVSKTISTCNFTYCNTTMIVLRLSFAWLI